jgi:hypothetical protein
MDPNNPNDGQGPALDIERMQAELQANAINYGGMGQYGDSQAILTQNRASFGNYGAMLMGGFSAVGGAAQGIYQGGRTALSAIGSIVRPIPYTPPARINVGYYGQYQQETGFFKSAIAGAGITSPQGTSDYTYGYNAAADFGDRVGNLGTSLARVGTGLVAGAMIGEPVGKMMGGVLGSVVGPTTARAMGFLGGLGGSLMAYQAVEAFGDHVAQRREMNAFLESSSFRYIGAGNPMADPRLGAGMSAGARHQVTDYMAQMQSKDTSMSFDDLSTIMREATSQGMFSGIKNIDSFKQKFKEITEGVKVITKTLGTTLQEGIKVMEDLKAINIMPGSMSDISMQASAVGKVSGRTAQEVVGIGLQGAELFRGTGIEAKIGYQSNVMNMASIRAARDAGVLSQETIIQAGGEEALAQRATAAGLGFMQSAMGRGFGGAFFNPAAGPAGFDKNAFMAAAGKGGLSMVELARRSAGNLGSPQNLIHYEAYQDKFMSEMGKAFGGDMDMMVGMSAMAEAEMLVSSGATKDKKAAMRLSLMKQGKDPADADRLMARLENYSNEYDAKKEATNQARIQRTVDEAESVRGLGVRFRRAKRIGLDLLEPATHLTESAMDSIREGVLRFREEKILGVERGDITGIDYNSIAAGAGGEGVDRKTVLSKTKAIDLDKTWAIFGESSGEAMEGMLKNLSVGIPRLKTLVNKREAGAGDFRLGSGRSANINEVEQEIHNLVTLSTKMGAADKLIEQKKAIAPTSGDTSMSKLLAQGTVGATQNILGMDQDTARMAAIGGGIASGAATGALVGSAVIPFVGTAVGAVVGGAVGGFYGYSAGAGTFDLLKRRADRGGDTIHELSKQLYKKDLDKLSEGELAGLKQKVKEMDEIGVHKYKEQWETMEKGPAQLESFVSNQTQVSVMQEARASILSTGTSVLGAAAKGVSEEGILKATTALTKYHQARTPEEKEKYRHEIHKSLYQGGGAKDPQKTAELLNTILEDKTLGDKLKPVEASAKALQATQAGKGYEDLQNMLRVELRTSNLSAEEASLAISASEKLAQVGVTALTKGKDGKAIITEKEMEAFAKTSAGASIVKGEQAVKVIDEVTERLKKEEEKKGYLEPSYKASQLNEAFRKNNIDLGKATGAVLESYEKEGLAGASKTVRSVVAQDTTSSTAAAGGIATGNAESSGAAGGSAAEAAAVQMQVNQQIKNVLEAMAQRLKVQ